MLPRQKSRRTCIWQRCERSEDHRAVRTAAAVGAV